ncbi:MAG TPA: hypothetical protein VJG64_04220 [Candidatus Paceibacterota bacterium]
MPSQDTDSLHVWASRQRAETEIEGAELTEKFKGYPHILRWIKLWILVRPSGIEFLEKMDFDNPPFDLRHLDNILKVFVFDVLPPL